MMHNQELFDKNLAYFEEHHPSIYQQLVASRPLSQVGIDPAGHVNIREREGKWLYRGGAAQYNEERLAYYWQNQKRLTIMRDLVGDRVCSQFYKRSSKRISDHFENKTQESVSGNNDAYIVAVFGIGSGYHLMPLAQESRCRHMLIMENNPDFLFHASQLIDWQELFEEVESRGGAISIIIANDETLLFSSMREKIWKMSLVSIDKAICYFDIASEAYSQLWSKLCRDFSSMIAGVGFFDDEVEHLRNTYTNLIRGDAKTVNYSPKPRHFPVFVVGSGPSLDRALPTIKQYQDKAIILAAGTAAEPLMANGIKPDFVVLLERGKELIDVYQKLVSTYALHDVPLVASATSYPGLMDLFKEGIYFFRPGLNTYIAFAHGRNDVLNGCDPTVTNTAVAFAMHYGFTNLYLFGVDCGSMDPEVHHAKQTVYYRDDKFKKEVKYTVQLPGNFGGTCHSTPVFSWTQYAMAHINHNHKNPHYFNCSDGAFIDGFIPKLPETVTIDHGWNKDEALAEVREHFNDYTAQQAKTRFDATKFRMQGDKFLDSIKRITSTEETLIRKDYVVPLMKLMSFGKACHPVQMMLRGSIVGMAYFIEFMMNRAYTEDEKQAVAHIFREEFHAKLDQLRDDLHALLDDLEAYEPDTEYAETVEQRVQELEKQHEAERLALEEYLEEKQPLAA